VELHIHAAATEDHTLSFQPKPLLDGGISTKLYFSSRSEHTLPGESERAV
jgi:hypothetical protein